MWSDNETDVDLLRFSYLASAVTRIIQMPHLLPTTIGVFGDWGTGKSSLIKMVQSRLVEQPDVMVLTFNGWIFEGYEDAKTALMGTILDAIQERTKAEKVLTDKGQDLLRKLLSRVNWLQLAGLAGRYALPALVGLPHLSLANIGHDAIQGMQKLPAAIAAHAPNIDVEAAQKLLNAAPDGPEQLRRNIRDFRNDFSELLKEAGIQTLVVFIDDLDRCFPDTVIETLEAIKLFLFVKGTAFVIGADERLVEYAVRQRFPELPGTATEVGRDYLEKLIQFPIRIPPLSSAEIESYINLLFAQTHLPSEQYAMVCEGASQFQANNITDIAFTLDIARSVLGDTAIPPELSNDLDLATQIAPILTPGMGGNPRRTKRFLNTLLLRMVMSADRGLKLQRQVLAKLMLLEYLKPEFFKQLARLQSAQDGEPAELRISEAVLRQPPVETVSEVSNQIDVSPEEGLAPSAKGRPNTIKQVKPVVLTEKDIPTDVQPWFADLWMRAWLTFAPALAHTDLRPYFYIAHDQVGTLADSPLRLSPAATDVLNRLLDTHEATQKLGLTRSANLSAADAIAVFQSLSQRIRQAESLDRAPQRQLFNLMSYRPELLPQVVILYGSLPDTKLTLAVPALVLNATVDTPSAEAARSVVERWGQSQHRPLARAAQAALKSAARGEQR